MVWPKDLSGEYSWKVERLSDYRQYLTGGFSIWEAVWVW
jgi:hypothetical protein